MLSVGFFAENLFKKTIFAVLGLSFVLFASNKTVFAVPAAMTVNDSLGADIDYTTSKTQLSGNWTASSDPSGINHYEYAIGTTVGGTNVVYWTNVGGSLSATKSGLNLVNGIKYYFSVKAVANDTSETISSSDGIRVAIPTTVTVSDGTGVDIDYANSNTQLSANWTASSDPNPARSIAKYWYAIGTSAGGTDVVGWTDNGLNLSVTKTGLSLTNEQIYYFSVKAENDVATQSEVASSDGQTVDITPPSNVILNDTPPAISNSTSATFVWNTARDNLSLAGYSYVLVTDATLPDDIVEVGEGGVEVTFTSLSDNTYFFRIKALDSAGNSSTVIAEYSFTVDTAAPVLTLNTAPDPIASGSVTITLNSNEPLAETESEDPPGSGILASVQQNGQPSPQNVLLTATSNPNEWDGTYTVNPLYTGVANVSVSVTDLVGNPQTANDTFTVNAPAATLTVTVDPTLLSSGNITIDIQSSAGLSATPTITVDQSGLTLTPTTPIYSTGTNQWRAVYTIDDSGTYDGTGTVTVDAIDLNLNPIQEIENFTADSTPPTDVTLTTFPSDPTSDSNIDFGWTATTDVTSGPYGYSYILTQNASATPDDTIELEVGFTSVTFSEVAPGAYYFKVKPLDNAGNAGNITVYSFTIDREAPVLTIDVDPPVINEGGTVDIRVTSNEALQSAPTVTVTQEGQSPSAPLTMTLDLGTPEIDWTTTYTAVAGDGTATVDASGTDLAGNPGTGQATFEVDSEGPDFNLSIDPLFISTGTVFITVTSETNLASLTVDVGGTPVTMTLTSSVPLYRWDGTHPVLTGATEGPTLVTAIGEDAATNTTTKNQTLTIDQTDPVADILIYPIDEIGGSVTGPATTTLSTAPYRIELTVTDANAILATPTLEFAFPSMASVPLTLISAGGSVWTADIFIDSDTPNDSATFSFSATDEAGNPGTTINSGGTFTVDTTITNTAGGTTQNSDGTKVTTPPNAYTGDYYIVITLANQSLFSVVTANNTSGVVPVTTANLLREFTVRTAPPPGTIITDFTLPSATIIITIPYPDANDDGIVDGTSILETNLRIFYLNETLNRWEMVVPYSLDPVNNFISANVNHLSIFGLLGIASGAALSNIVVYPNPFYAKRDGFVTITNIPLAGSASVFIYNLAGELVRRLEDGSGITSTGIVKQARWDGRNSGGQKCASGMYVYLLKTNFGTKKGKIGLFW